MITCPLCQQPVYLAANKKDITVLMNGDDKSDFRCATNTEGLAWCHYQRHSNLGFIDQAYQAIQVYQALIMPFRIVWYPTGKLEVDRIVRYTQDAIYKIRPIWKTETRDFEEFVRACRRFSKLKAFS